MAYTQQCLSRVERAWQAIQNGTFPAPPWPELVGPNGVRIPGLTPSNASGITISPCYDHCGHIYSTFSFPTFSGAVTSWLFLWLALIAQLPYATSSSFLNAFSAFLAVGSPALAAFSLVITMQKKMHISSAFRTLKSEAHRPKVFKRYPGLGDKLDSMQVILQESLQAPIRIGNINELCSIIVLDDNIQWLASTKKNLKNTQRETTISLIAQILFALLAWAFTVAASFEDLGDVTVALSLSSSSIWLWMVPVITGFVAVGTQSDSGKVRAALHQTERDIRIAHIKDRTPRHGSQNALLCATGILDSNDDDGTIRSQNPPTYASVPLTGLEGEEGPLFNFARLLTFPSVTDPIIEGFAAMIDKIKRGKRPDGLAWDDLLPPRENLAGNADQVTKYCIDEQATKDWDAAKDTIACNATSHFRVQSYTPWQDVPGRVWRQLLVASLAAMFVQWGTTTPSIVISILTPATGLGCRSGSFLIYGSLATIVCALVVLASLLSHNNMLRDQARNGIRSPVLELAQVSCQYLGGFLAVCNAVWVVTSCVMELCGAFDNCWCQGVALSQHPWVLLFKGAPELRGPAQPVWVGGIAFEVIVCVICCAFVWLGCK